MHPFCVAVGRGKISVQIVIKQKYEKLEFQLGSEISIFNGEKSASSLALERSMQFDFKENIIKKATKKNAKKFSAEITRRNKEHG